MVVVRGGMVVNVYKHQLGNILTSPGCQVSIYQDQHYSDLQAVNSNEGLTGSY